VPGTTDYYCSVECDVLLSPLECARVPTRGVVAGST
jgi:hypothetical protein